MTIASVLTPDERTVHGFLEAFVALAIESLVGHPPPGLLQMCRKHPNDNDLVPVRYKLDDADLVDRMTHDALVASEAGLNIYIEGRLVRFDLRGRKRGELKDTTCVFALAVNSDADKNMGGPHQLAYAQLWRSKQVPATRSIGSSSGAPSPLCAPSGWARPCAG